MNRSATDASTAEEETDEEEATSSALSISSETCSAPSVCSSAHSSGGESGGEEQHLCPAARLFHCNSSPSPPPSPPKRSRKRLSSHRNQRKKSSSLFMEEELIEEEECEVEEGRRRVTSAMKVREDTLDGAEEPDKDPPLRRKTIEDISIEELSALRANLPPEFPDEESPPTLLPCLTCNRTFNPTALNRHRKVCQKLSETSKKKQVFNAQTQRFEGLESGGLSTPTSRAKTPERGKAAKKTSKWREKHKEFLRTIRAARGAPEGDADAGGPSIPIDYIQCPHCERHFGPKAADRHIDWCREQSTRMRRTSADVQLTERLRSRTKYVPPKPGQGGWKAPKKTDVISSIPPPSSGPTPDLRKLSPPHLLNPYARRGASPGPQRKISGTGSLGRAAARSFSSLLQAVNSTYQSPYGQRMSASGYATPSSYSAYGGHMGGSQTPNLSRSGSFSGATPGGFSRSASLRVPNSRRATGGGKMARRRDLASDMLASVMQGSPARGEPEGDEAEEFSSRETTLSPPPYKSYSDNKYESPFDSKFESSYSPTKFEVSKFEANSKFDDLFDTKFDDPVMDQLSYDPYSAAEMQMQALLGTPSEKKPSDNGGGLGAAGLGTGGVSSPTYRSNKSFLSPSSPSPRHRLSKLNTSLSPALHRRAESPCFSDVLSSSPAAGKSSPWRLSPSPPPKDRWSPHSPTHAWSPTRSSPTRDMSYGRSSLSSGGKGGFSTRETRYSVSSEGIRQEDRGLSPFQSDDKSSQGLKRPLRSSLSSGGSPERLSSPFTKEKSFTSKFSPFERTQGNGSSETSTSLFRRNNQRDAGSSVSSLKALRDSIQGKYGTANKAPTRSSKQVRSSSSSSEASLPLLSSPSMSPSPSATRGHTKDSSLLITTPRLDFKKSSTASNNSNAESLDQIISSLTSIGTDPGKHVGASASFCHECGIKYPTDGAKFCCHCGSRRSSGFH